MRDDAKRVKTSPPCLWEGEYAQGGIPSSVRSRPSNVLLDFIDKVSFELPQASRALDIGCGTGRNAIFLAETGYDVKAMDYAASQIELLQAYARSRPALRLEAVVGDVTQVWPWSDGCTDIAIDAYCFKHQIETDGIETYIRELRRCLVPGGMFMLFLATRTDEYYRQFAVPHQYGIGSIIVDAGNGIASRLYAREEVERLFAEFDVLSFSEKTARNEMHGKTYDRCSGIWHLRRK